MGAGSGKRSMKESKIHNLLNKIKTTTPAHALETQHLDFKRFRATSNHENHKKKLSSLLWEYTVAFANSKGGTLMLGIEKNVTEVSNIMTMTYLMRHIWENFRSRSRDLL